MKLTKVREALKLTQLDVALILGRSLSTVSRLERGIITPSYVDASMLDALEHTAELKRPPCLPLILQRHGRAAALKALATD